MGYRFELTNSSVANNVLTVNLQNTGFANIFKPRKAFLVMKNTATSTEYSFEISGDLKTWREGAPIQITKTLDMVVPAGTYQLFLNLPDLNSTNPAYSIRCANVDTWDAVKGYNNLKQTVVMGVTPTPTTTTPPPVTTTPPPVTTTPTVQPVEILLNASSVIEIYYLPSTTYTIQVYNMQGKLKATTTDISNLRSGYYIVKVYCNGNIYTKKVLKP